MTVTVGGKQYEISGGAYGSIPAWDLIKYDGKRMTGEQFRSLPVADQQELIEYIRKYLDQGVGP